MNTIDPISVFRVEAAECFEAIEASLLDLLHSLDDRDLIDAVFRGLHTLKGSGAMFGFEALAAFTHHCETAFDLVRKGEAPATAELVTAILAAQDHMKELVENPHSQLNDTSNALLLQLETAVSGGGQNRTGDHVMPSSPAKPIARELKRWEISFRLPANALVNGTNPLGLLDELRELGPCVIVADMSAVPPLDEIEPTAIYIAWRVTLESEFPRSAIDDVFIFVLEDMELAVVDLNRVATPVEKPIPETNALETGASSTPIPDTRKPTEAARDVTAPADTRHPRTHENVKVPAERLDELMDRVGELVIAQSRLSQLASATADVSWREVSEDIERLSGELRDTMMVLRMVPVATLFSRFRRLVHDLARETGKVIELVTEGETTEVDKTVIERLADPLVHLVRNSIDHGLEVPAERVSAGKTKAGTVTLSARQAGGEVIISIKDDGRGINRERVRAKAESSGLIQVGQPLSDAELLQLIFAPGFSTAAAVTNLSGRGVGMDVVKKTVEALRGAIDIESRPGEGSEVSLRIPLTLAIIDGLLVRVGSGRYVIPLSAVEECLELSIEEDLRSRGRSFISLRDSLVPFLRLRDLFQSGTTPDKYQKVVVISTGTERVGLVVDQIIGDHQTVIKSMSKLHSDVATFSGATILGDGSVALILDVGHLVAASQQQEAHMRMAG